MIMIFGVVAVIRMGNWTQNDTFRAAGDAAFGTILEIAFMWGLVIPCVWLTGMVWKLPTLAVFACCYVDEPIRYGMMQTHLFRGKFNFLVSVTIYKGDHAIMPRLKARKRKVASTVGASHVQRRLLQQLRFLADFLSRGVAILFKVMLRGSIFAQQKLPYR